MTYFALYEAYGTRPYEWGDDPDRQKANTKEEEKDLGLLNEGMRYRDLETGVFLTRDPIGYADGPNVYCYVHCNPITSFDPLGLYDEDDVVDRGTKDFGTEEFQSQYDDAGDYDNFNDWFSADGNKDKYYNHLAMQGHDIYNSDYSTRLREGNAQMAPFLMSSRDIVKQTYERLAHEEILTSDQTKEIKGLVDGLEADPTTTIFLDEKKTQEMLRVMQGQTLFQMKENHGEMGDYDFKGMEKHSGAFFICIVDGKVMRGDQFGNYGAGYAASGNVRLALDAVLLYGHYFDAKDSDGYNFDRDSSPDIWQGYKDGRRALPASHPQKRPVNFKPYPINGTF